MECVGGEVEFAKADLSERASERVRVVKGGLHKSASRGA